MGTLIRCFALSCLLVLFSSSTLSADGIIKIENIRRGMQVVLQGEVLRITDEDEFRLRDETGSVLVYIGWRNRVMVRVGEKVTVKGIVDDDLSVGFRPEVYAYELVREDGSVIKLKGE